MIGQRTFVRSLVRERYGTSASCAEQRKCPHQFERHRSHRTDWINSGDSGDIFRPELLGFLRLPAFRFIGRFGRGRVVSRERNGRHPPPVGITWLTAMKFVSNDTCRITRFPGAGSHQFRFNRSVGRFEYGSNELVTATKGGCCSVPQPSGVAFTLHISLNFRPFPVTF